MSGHALAAGGGGEGRRTSLAVLVSQGALEADLRLLAGQGRAQDLLLLRGGGVLPARPTQVSKET